VPALAEFVKRHPQVEVEVIASDSPPEFVGRELDVAVRIRELPDSGMRARRLGELRVVVFGTPSYLAMHGRPAHPEDLARHRCVVRVAEEGGEAWSFGLGGRQVSVPVRGPFRTDSTPVIHAAVAHGLGLGRTALWEVRDLVGRGVVELVLERFEAPKLPIYAV
jgi:DNA-binding transcriptional LysR family regulator